MLKRFVMLKANQLFPYDRNDSILMILISNDQPYVLAALISIQQRRSVAILGRAPVNWRSVLWVSCLIRLWAQSPASNGFYCAQEASRLRSETCWSKGSSQDLPINCGKCRVTFVRKIVSLLAQFSQLAEAVSSARDEDSPSVVQWTVVWTVKTWIFCVWWNRLTVCFTFNWFSQCSCRERAELCWEEVTYILWRAEEEVAEARSSQTRFASSKTQR